MGVLNENSIFFIMGVKTEPRTARLYHIIRKNAMGVPNENSIFFIMRVKTAVCVKYSGRVTTVISGGKRQRALPAWSENQAYFFSSKKFQKRG
jgi:hypothetical protein